MKIEVTDDIVALFIKVARTQKAFWEALSELEGEIGHELESTDDLIDLDNRDAVEAFLHDLGDSEETK